MTSRSTGPQPSIWDAIGQQMKEPARPMEPITTEESAQLDEGLIQWAQLAGNDEPIQAIPFFNFSRK